MSNIRVVTTKAFASQKGSIYPIEFGSLPFNPQRLFFIRDVPFGEERGNHAHRTCHQILIPNQGSIKLLERSLKQIINHGNMEVGRRYHIPPLTWIIIKDFTPGAVLTVLASEPYDDSEYIRDFKEFERIKASSK